MLDSLVMSTFTYAALVASPGGATPPVEVKFLVDTGAMFTCLPTRQLEDLGVRPGWGVPIIMADGRQDTWMAAEIALTIDRRTLHTTCLFGPPDGLPLLGAVSLEQFALAVDPLNRTLVPTRVPMATLTRAGGSGRPSGHGRRRAARA